MKQLLLILTVLTSTICCQAQSFSSVSKSIDETAHAIVLEDRNGRLEIPLDYHALKGNVKTASTSNGMPPAMQYQNGKVKMEILFSSYNDNGFSITYTNPGAWISDTFQLTQEDFSKEDARLVKTYIKNLYASIKWGKNISRCVYMTHLFLIRKILFLYNLCTRIVILNNLIYTLSSISHFRRPISWKSYTVSFKISWFTFSTSIIYRY